MIAKTNPVLLGGVEVAARLVDLMVAIVLGVFIHTVIRHFIHLLCQSKGARPSTGVYPKDLGSLPLIGSC